MIKKIIMIVAVFATMSMAGMIEYTDNDPIQEITIDCDWSVTDSVKLWFYLEDSGMENYYAFTADTSLSSHIFQFINPDRDENDRLIPGHYEGEYYLYTESFLTAGGSVLDPDTTHIWVEYDIPAPCGVAVTID